MRGEWGASEDAFGVGKSHDFRYGWFWGAWRTGGVGGRLWRGEASRLPLRLVLVGWIWRGGSGALWFWGNADWA